MRTELVTTLKRRATKLLSQLEKAGEPILITQHGVPSAYLVDVESYEKLQRRVALLESIALDNPAAGPRGFPLPADCGAALQDLLSVRRAAGTHSARDAWRASAATAKPEAASQVTPAGRAIPAWSVPVTRVLPTTARKQYFAKIIREG